MSGKRSRRRPGVFSRRGGEGRGSKNKAPAANQTLKTIRSSVLAYSESSSHGLPESAEYALEVMPQLTPIDVSEAYRWFWDEAPSDEDFSYSDIPGLVPPGLEEAARTGGEDAVLLLEGAVPRTGLAWSSPVSGSGEVLTGSMPQTSASAVMQAAAKADVGCFIQEEAMADGEASVLILEGGLLSRAGALLSWAPGSVPDGPRRVISSAATETNLSEVAGTLTVLPYALIPVGGEDGERTPGGGEVVDASPLAYEIPVSNTSRPIVGAADELSVGFGDDQLAGEQDPESIRAMLMAQRSVMLAALFALSCFNDATRQDSHCRITRSGGDGYGEVDALELAKLQGKLRKGVAGGLAHSLLTLDHYGAG